MFWCFWFFFLFALFFPFYLFVQTPVQQSGMLNLSVLKSLLVISRFGLFGWRLDDIYLLAFAVGLESPQDREYPAEVYAIPF